MSPFQSKWFFQVLILTRSSKNLFYILMPVLNICTFQSSFSVPMSSLMILNKIRVLHQHHQTDTGNNWTITWLIWRGGYMLHIYRGSQISLKKKLTSRLAFAGKRLCQIFFFSVFPLNVKWLWKSDILLIFLKSINIL